MNKYYLFFFTLIILSCNSKSISLEQSPEGEWGDANDGAHHFTITKSSEVYVIHDFKKSTDFVLKVKTPNLLTDGSGVITLAYRTEPTLSEFRKHKAWFLSFGPDNSGNPNDGIDDPIILGEQKNEIGRASWRERV